jgi:hypothetical protein
MTRGCADVIQQALWAKACSMAIHIKKCLLHSVMKLKKSPDKIMFGNKPSIKYLYPCGSKCYVYVPKVKYTLMSKFSLAE